MFVEFLVVFCRLVLCWWWWWSLESAATVEEARKIRSGDRGSAVALGDDKVESGDPDPIDPRAARTVASG